MLHTRICELLGIEHPILSAPMAGTAGAALAAAVSAAGGLGIIGGSGGDSEWLRGQIRAVRERTEKPFGVGFISSRPSIEELTAVAIEERVPVITHSFADPTPFVAAIHDAGIIMIAQVQTVAQARVAAAAGVDVIAAQGTEAGGHTGYSGTLPLVPAVVDVAGGIPVIAAGGIADGRGVAAVLMLGAEGVWLGSRFVASVEAEGGSWVKERVVAAGTDDTVLTRAYDLVTQAPFPPGIGDRVVRNDYTDAWHGHDDELPAHRPALHAQLVQAAKEGDARIAPTRAGNAVGLIHAIQPAGDIVRAIVAEAERILRERPGHLVRYGV
ncbi:MAG: nitronate monooxygenase [Thermomicrobia bacterium]|nr:nitronate monooxygenase [Thermomicrobia bacterium]